MMFCCSQTTGISLIFVAILAVSAACRGAGCNEPEPLDGPTLEYTIDDEAVPERRLRVHAHRLTEEVDNERNPDVDFEFTYDDREMYVETSGPEQTTLVEEVVSEEHPALEQVARVDNKLRLYLPDDAIEQYLSSVLPEVVGAIERRLDKVGFPEARVRQKQASRLEVALPELSDGELERVKEAVRNFQTLRFVLVDDAQAKTFFADLEGELPEGFELCEDRPVPRVVHEKGPGAREAMEEFFEGRVPDDRRIGYEFVEGKDNDGGDEGESGGESVVLQGGEAPNDMGPCQLGSTHWRAHLLERATQLENHHVLDTGVAVDKKTQRPVLSLTFTEQGTELFAELTRQNIEERFAMVVGNTVHSAPVINEPIPNGRVQLSMGAMKSFEKIVQEAEDLNNKLRAQSAPIELELTEVKRGNGE
jgi:preprotein translocase subunit SecD